MFCPQNFLYHFRVRNYLCALNVLCAHMFWGCLLLVDVVVVSADPYELNANRIDVRTSVIPGGNMVLLWVEGM